MNKCSQLHPLHLIFAYCYSCGSVSSLILHHSHKKPHIMWIWVTPVLVYGVWMLLQILKAIGVWFRVILAYKYGAYKWFDPCEDESSRSRIFRCHSLETHIPHVIYLLSSGELRPSWLSGIEEELCNAIWETHQVSFHLLIYIYMTRVSRKNWPHFLPLRHSHLLWFREEKRVVLQPFHRINPYPFSSFFIPHNMVDF